MPAFCRACSPDHRVTGHTDAERERGTRSRTRSPVSKRREGITKIRRAISRFPSRIHASFRVYNWNAILRRYHTVILKITNNSSTRRPAVLSITRGRWWLIKLTVAQSRCIDIHVIGSRKNARNNAATSVTVTRHVDGEIYSIHRHRVRGVIKVGVAFVRRAKAGFVAP